MLSNKVDTLLEVVRQQSYTCAAAALSLTQPAVSHHIRQLEEELGVRLFEQGKKGRLQLTREGEIAVKYARRMQALQASMQSELADAERHLTRLRVGITHTAESNLIAETLAKYSSASTGVTITIRTDTIKNLYEMLNNFELDLIIVEDRPDPAALNALLLDTDCLVCAVCNRSPLARQTMVTIDQLKKQKMILRRAGSATRILFEGQLAALGESIDNFDVILEVDNIATIKDLIRKGLGASILAKSACMDEGKKGKLTLLPVENLSMAREMNIVYHKDFAHPEVLQSILRLYREAGHALLEPGA